MVVRRNNNESTNPHKNYINLSLFYPVYDHYDSEKKKIFDFALVLKSIISIDLSGTIVGAFPKAMPKNDQISSSLNYALVSVGDKGSCASRIRHLSEPGIQLFLASYFLFPILHKSLSKVQL